MATVNKNRQCGETVQEWQLRLVKEQQGNRDNTLPFVTGLVEKATNANEGSTSRTPARYEACAIPLESKKYPNEDIKLPDLKVREVKTQAKMIPIRLTPRKPKAKQ